MKILMNKFYPNNVKWGEPNCNYLGSVIKEGREYDLGLWVSEDKSDMSWFFVQSEKTGDYQSGCLLQSNKLYYHVLKSKYNDHSVLPVIEVVRQSQLQKFLNKTVLKNFNFNIKYIYGSDICQFLIEGYKCKGITLYLKKNMIKLTDVIIIKANNKWCNKFFHKGKYYEASDIFLIEDT